MSVITNIFLLFAGSFVDKVGNTGQLCGLYTLLYNFENKNVSALKFVTAKY